VSLFRIVKYSSLLFFLRRYRGRIFRVLAVLLFALVTNLLYQDVAHYLQLRHPGALLWALVGKIIIVYGALAFVLWQFRPVREQEPSTATTGTRAGARAAPAREQPPAAPDRLSALADLEHHDRLRTRYDAVLEARRKTARNPE